MEQLTYIRHCEEAVLTKQSYTFELYNVGRLPQPLHGFAMTDHKG
jgi:hypothetical protein